jgi:hypothetical protein
LCVVSDECTHVDSGARPKSKRSLDFTSPSALSSASGTEQPTGGDTEWQLLEVRIMLEWYWSATSCLQVLQSEGSPTGKECSLLGYGTMWCRSLLTF